MPKFKFYGSATVNGAWFYVTAPDAQSAQRRAGNSDFDEVDYSNSEIIDADIKIGTVESMG